MKRRFSLIAVAVLCLPLMMGNSGCNDRPQVSSSGATQVGAGQIVPKNSRGRTSEQQNIEDRIRVTTDPTKVMWNHLISLDGKVIRRMPVRNKITSSGKRLEPKHAVPYYNQGYMPSSGVRVPGTRDDHFATNELMQPDGTFGDSDNYVFWFDPMGRYHQYGTAGGIGYLLTDYPIDLEDPINKITGLYNVQKQAAQWQEEQEAALRKKEGKK
ncbi:MAG: hypothetical protein Q8L52_03025 [bacterium]|nr:hypothetical protein [bacterium]